jgi:hypothetical protein
LIGCLSIRPERSEHSKACDKRDAYHAVPPNVCASFFLTLRTLTIFLKSKSVNTKTNSIIERRENKTCIVFSAERNTTRA